jgi:hypothetical protein
MNIQSIYLGQSANDYTGDPLRVGGFKINDNFLELFTNNAFRHRHSLLVYKTLSGSPNYLTYSGLDVNLVAPVVGVIGQAYEQRGERNLPFVITSDVNSAWTVPASSMSFLYIEKNSLSGTPIYGYSPYYPVVSETPAVAPLSGQHWYNLLENVMYEWDGSDFIAVNRLFVGYVVATNSIQSLGYITDNDESRTLAAAMSAVYLSAQEYTDLAISEVSGFIVSVSNQYTDQELLSAYNQIDLALLSAKNYTDEQIVLVEVSAYNYTDAALVSANQYSDLTSYNAYLSAKTYADEVSATVTALSTIESIADAAAKKWAIVLG